MHRKLWSSLFAVALLATGLVGIAAQPINAQTPDPSIDRGIEAVDPGLFTVIVEVLDENGEDPASVAEPGQVVSGRLLVKAGRDFVAPEGWQIIGQQDSNGMVGYMLVPTQDSATVPDGYHSWICDTCSSTGDGTDGLYWAVAYNNMQGAHGGGTGEHLTPVDISHWRTNRVMILHAGYDGKDSNRDSTWFLLADGTIYEFNPPGVAESYVLEFDPANPPVAFWSDDSVIVIGLEPSTSTPQPPTQEPPSTSTPQPPTQEPPSTSTPQPPTQEPPSTSTPILTTPPAPPVTPTATKEAHLPAKHADVLVCTNSDRITVWQSKGDRWVQMGYASPDRFGWVKLSLGGDERPFKLMLTNDQGRVIPTESGTESSRIYTPVLDHVSNNGDMKFFDTWVHEWDAVLCVPGDDSTSEQQRELPEPPTPVSSAPEALPATGAVAHGLPAWALFFLIGGALALVGALMRDK